MAQDTNIVVIVGRLTRDPEAKYLPSGTAVMDFSIASNDRVKQGDEWVDKASFFDCTIFGRQAEVLPEFLTKGQQVCVNGKLVQETWQDKQSGGNRSKVKIIANNVQMLGGKPGSGSRDQQRQAESGEESQERPETTTTAPTGDVPF